MSEAKKNILVVDDDPDVVDQVTTILSAAGYNVLSGYSRAEGEELLLRMTPDVAVLDLMMEEKDSGFVFCHTVKKMYPDAKVIILTAVAAETGMSFRADSERERSWIGADLMMDKPARAEQLVGAVRQLLDR